MASPTAVVYGPAQIASAYAVTQHHRGRITGNGSGQTIAIVDAYNDPTIGGDLATFDTTFGLAPPPNLTVVNQLGNAPPLTTDSGWAIETSLDVEWAHAMAPNANILLVEANSASLANLLTAVKHAADTYVNNSPVTVVSMSWGTGEFLARLRTIALAPRRPPRRDLRRRLGRFRGRRPLAGVFTQRIGGRRHNAYRELFRGLGRDGLDWKRRRRQPL